jgi:hypothetical protein
MGMNLPNTLLKLGLALAKHHAKNLIGDEALEIFTTTLVDIGGESLQAKVDSILASQDGQNEVFKAAKAADQCFREKCEDKDFRELFTMEHGNLSSIQNAIANLPKTIDDKALREILFKVFREELPKRIRDEQVHDGVNLYAKCLQDALLPVKDFGLHVLHYELREIGADVKSIKADVKLLVGKTETDTQNSISSMPGLYITSDVIMPYEKTSNEVVIGKAVSIDHIRDQRFMLRKDVLADAIFELDLFVEKHLNNIDPEIVTFWISGRSGSGKSVLLLQLLQEIVLKRGAQAIWLDDAAEMFSVLLEKWADKQTEIHGPVFVFVDDFNSPQTRDKIDFKAIARMLRNPRYHKHAWPILVTCSPPEYFEEFQKTGGAEYFQVRKWLIPPVSKSEQSSFLEWFSTRTG